MTVPEREGYTYIGSVSVDSASLIIGDPDYLLRWGDEDTTLASKPTTKDVDDAWPRVMLVSSMAPLLLRSDQGMGTVRTQCSPSSTTMDVL